MVLTKSDILRGVETPELIFIKSLKGELPLRPLSKTEVIEIEKIEVKAYGIFETNETAQRRGMRQNKQLESQLKTHGKINLEKQAAASFEGKVLAMYLSLNNSHLDAEKWNKSEIQSLPGRVFDEIFEHVQRLSGLNITEEDVNSFPKE